MRKTPLIFFSAALLAASAFVSPAASANPLSNGCSYNVRELVGPDKISLGRAGETSQTVGRNGGDDALSTYRTRVGGKDVTVTILRGISDSDATRAVDSMQAQWNELAKKSLGPQEEETGIRSVNAAPVSGTMETVSITVDDDSGTVEVSAPQGSQVVDNSGRTTGCTRVAKGQTVTVSGKNDSVTTVATAAAAASQSRIDYKTFISAAAVDGGPCGRFAGDNRSYSYDPGASSRTKVYIYYNWGTSNLSYWPQIGETKKINSSGGVIQTATASTAGITISSTMMSSSYGRTQLNHAVANPLCGYAGSINYSVVASAWSNGTAQLQGTALKAPYHEAYYWTSGYLGGSYGLKTFFKVAGDNLMCLNVNCGTRSISTMAT